MASSTELKKIFAKLVRSNGLAHAYLFFGTGARGEEARAFSESFASYLETGAWERTGTLIDAQVLHGQDTGIEAVRGAIRFLSRKPLRSSRKTLIISGADLLTIPAEQALLKVIEEPPESACIILIAKDVEGIIPTLASRLQKVYVSGVESTGGEEETAQALLEAKTSKERSELLKALAEDEARLSRVLATLVHVLRRDSVRNAQFLAALLKRWTAMGRYSTNRKLQLEAAFAEGRT